MATMSLTTAQGYLDAWIGAQAQLTSNTSYTITFPNGTSRTLTRTDEADVRNQITYWHRVVNELTAVAAGAPNTGARMPVWS